MSLRKHLRVAWRLPMVLTRQDGGESVRATSCNLSAGGLLAFAGGDWREGLDLRVQFEAGGQRFALGARIARTQPHEQGLVAVAFAGVQAGELTLLRQVVLQQALRQMTALGEMPVFWDLGDHELLALAGACHEVALRQGSTYPEYGDEATSAMFVRSGCLQVRGRDGTRVCHRGQSFGERGLLGGQAQCLEIAALEATELFVLPRAAFVHLKECDPQLAVTICELLLR